MSSRKKKKPAKTPDSRQVTFKADAAERKFLDEVAEVGYRGNRSEYIKSMTIMSEAEWEAFSTAADEAGLPLHLWMRQTCREAVGM